MYPGEVPDMAKTKSKVKFDFKDFLLKKGEYLAMGIAGFFLFLLLVWGVTKWAGAKDPVAINKELTSKANSVQSQIAGDQVSDADKAEAELPAWVQSKINFKPVPAEDFKFDQSAVRPDRQARHQEGEPPRPADGHLPGRSDSRVDEGLRHRAGDRRRTDDRGHL